MKVAFAGVFAAQIAEPVRARLPVPCDVVVDDEPAIVARLGDVDVLVSMGFTPRHGRRRAAASAGAGARRRPRSHRSRARSGRDASGQRLRPRRRHRRVHHRRHDRAHPLASAASMRACARAGGRASGPSARRRRRSGRSWRARRSASWASATSGRRWPAARAAFDMRGLRHPATGPGGNTARRGVHRRPGAARRGAAPGRLSRRSRSRSRRDARPDR